MNTFERLESEVRSYCRSFPAVFTRAQGWHLYDEAGREYLDFFAGAGVLNYGHNPPRLRDRLIDYLRSGGVVHTLDMSSTAKRDFLEAFERFILQPRKLSYKMQFPGPTGTNAVEAALKLARKITGRQRIMSFTNAFHGMTLGSLAVTGNGFKRAGAGVPLTLASPMPFDGYLGDDVDTLGYLDAFLTDSGSGVELPAAIIVETVQAEGGVNVARMEWLRGLTDLARRHGILLIVDDIQVGCGRTGPFFSFEAAGIRPDIVCLSKSLSGFGLPFALVLLKPELDAWAPGEHNGTFRGHNLAMVTATAALETYWSDEALQQEVKRKGEMVRRRFQAIAERHPQVAAGVRGRGLIQGIDVGSGEVASAICRKAFENGLVVETSGPESNVVKALPPLVIEEAALARGLDILERAAREVLGSRRVPTNAAA